MIQPQSEKGHRWLNALCKRHGTATQAPVLQGTLEEAWTQAGHYLSLDPLQLADLVAKDSGLEPARLPDTSDRSLFRLIPRAIAERFLIFPLLSRRSHITVACANPYDDETSSILGFMTAATYEKSIAPPNLIREWIDSRYDTVMHKSETSQPLKASTEQLSEGLLSANGDSANGDSAIVDIVSDMLLESYSQGASDIHVEPFLDGGVIRYRIDGLLRKVATLPMPVFVHMLQRIKATSNMNVATRLVPQDGNASITLQGEDVDLRVSTIPVSGGEKAVIRLLTKNTTGTIDAIGLASEEEQALRRIISHPNGILLITGPTGSGKTSTLYAILKELNTYERCLVTVEDPIEYQIDGIAQIAVNRAQNVTFSTALRAILRQDPDVILVGETRDHETAEVTFQAALTGHLVMTTLHTNDAIATIPRLRDLEIPATILADSLRGLASQRLVRKLCAHCADLNLALSDQQSQRFHDLFPESSPRAGRGCTTCHQTGYDGRLALLEVVEVSPALADAIRRGEDTVTLRQLADNQGNRPMAEIAADAIRTGKTSAEEVHRVLGEAFWSHLAT